MNKKTILSIALSFSSLFCFAETSVIDYTYAEGALEQYGKGKKEVVDVAMCINDPSLVGMKIKALKAYVSTPEGLSSPSLWMSSALKLENRVNAPDIASYNVEIVPARVADMDCAMLYVELEEPYELTSEPLYIGYTVDVVDIATEEQQNPIIMADNVNPNGFFLHMSKSVTKWTAYSDKAEGVAFIAAAIEGEFSEYSLGFKGYEPIYANMGEPFEAEFKVTNMGATTVNSLTYAYSINGGETVTCDVELPAPIKPSLTATVPVTLQFDAISEIGAQNLKVTILSVNGMDNGSSAATIEAIVNVVPFTPVHKPLVEEYTGLWCGWCTRGFLAMEMIAEKYPDSQVSICYHNGDPMQVTDRYPINVSGFPNASIDRKSQIDPYYGNTNQEFGISINLENAMATLAIADIVVDASYDAGVVTANATARFIQDMDNANYQIGYVLVADGLYSNSWIQHNYYAGESGYEGTYLQELTEWPEYVMGLTFKDVAIDVTGMMGIEGSVPTEIKAGEKYANTFSIDTNGNDLVQNCYELTVAAYVLDKSNGSVVNSNKCSVDVINDNAVESIRDNTEILSTDYYDLSGRRIANPSGGLFIKTVRLSDGSLKSTKVILGK